MMERQSKKRLESYVVERKNPARWISPLFVRKKNHYASMERPTWAREPSKMKARPNLAQKSSVRNSRVEVMEIVDSDERDKDENDSAQQIEPATTNTALLSRNENNNADSSSPKAKETIGTKSTDKELAYKEKDHVTCRHRNEADTDTALPSEEKETIETAKTDSLFAWNNNGSCTSVGQNEQHDAVELALTDRAMSCNENDTLEPNFTDPDPSRKNKENQYGLADINENDTDTFLAADDERDYDTALTGSIENNKDKETLFFQTHCWLCHVQLTSEEDQVCCYAKHTHPVLKTPLCSVCYDIMKDVVREHSACAGCGEETETAFLCDNIIEDLVCQNEFCFECVKKAGLDVLKLQASKDAWHCLACNPTSMLQSLCTPNRTLQIISERTTEDILHELEVAEEKKRECEEALEDTSVRLKSQEIFLELKRTVPELELREAVEDELNAWKELQMNHEARLGDFISKLQDELEVRGIDMATVYHSHDYLSIPTPTLPEYLPQWVQTADMINAQRPKFEKPVLPASEYEKDYTDDLVEIAEMDALPDFVVCRGSGWVVSKYKPTLSDFHNAQEKEDEILARRKISKKISRRSETGDKNIMKNEHKIHRVESRSGKRAASATPAGMSDRSRSKKALTIGFASSPRNQQAEDEQSECKTEAHDELLSHTIPTSESEKGIQLIRPHYYHDDSLLRLTHGGEVEHARILLATEAGVKNQSSNESKVLSSTNSIETVPLRASETAIKDHRSEESKMKSAAHLRDYVPSEAPVTSTKEVASCTYEPNVSAKMDETAVHANEKPENPRLSRNSPEIIDLCSSSSDES